MVSSFFKYNLIKQVILLFVTLTCFCAKASDKATLSLKIIDCRDEEKFSYLAELKVLKDGKHFKTLKPEHEKQIILKNLEFGEYILLYKSMFGKEVNQKIVITENKTYSLNLCINFIDYSKESYKAIIDQLKEKEEYTIIVISQGCFHHTLDSIIIKRANNVCKITWGEKTKILTAVDLESIRHFEFELAYMNEDGCTTTDMYYIIYNNKTKKNRDGSCDWRGAYYLKKQLFGEQ